MSIDNYMLPCLNKKLFGLDCLGCGIQRSIIHLFKGEFMEAFNIYPAIYTLLLMGLFYLVSLKIKINRRKQILITFTAINTFVIVISYIFKMKSILIN